MRRGPEFPENLWRGATTVPFGDAFLAVGGLTPPLLPPYTLLGEALDKVYQYEWRTESWRLLGRTGRGMSFPLLLDVGEGFVGCSSRARQSQEAN